MTKRTRARKISPCYLLDFAVFKGPDDWKIDFHSAQEDAWKWDVCDRENYEFTRRVFERSGIGRIGSYLPPWLNPTTTAAMGIQPRYDLDSAAEEARIVMVSLARDALAKAGLKPTDVDVLITASTVFSPVPSLASMVVNALKMREDVQAYNLGGMGCSNGVISLSLVRDFLQARPNCVVLFIPAEIVTSALYIGHDRARMITNALFRAGGAAAVFTNRRDLKRRAKYKLLQQERVHTGASDVAFRAMYYGPDGEGHTGIALTKDIPPEASKAIDRVLRVVTPRILTVPQYLDFALDWCLKRLGVKGEKKARREARREARRAAKGGSEAAKGGSEAATSAGDAPSTSDDRAPRKADPYAPPPRDPDEWLPDYTRCIDHFILHAGGYGVLKGIQKGMRLPSDALLPSFATLRDVGNTSSSSTWYTFAYLESVSRGVRRGERLLQLGVGGGMKAAAAVWKAMRDVEDTHPVWSHLERRPVRHEELPRLIDESAEAAREITAAIARDAEELARARDEERERRRAAAAAAADEASAVALGTSSRADSAAEHEIERAFPRPGQKGKAPSMVRDDSAQKHEQQPAGKRGGAVVVPSEIAEASRAVEA